MRPVVLLVFAFLMGCSHSEPVEEINVINDVSKVTMEGYVPRPKDWPGWRGLKHDGSTNSVAPPLNWSDRQSVLWKRALPGRGHASPVLVDDLIVLSTAIDSEEKQLLVAFQRDTGEPAWQLLMHEGGFPSDRELHQKGTNANSTVACDQKHFYVAYLNDNAIVASAVSYDGQLVWQTELGPFQSKFGYAPSPQVHGPYVIFAADNGGGGYLAAVNRATGEIAWRKQRSSKSSYSSPVVANISGKDQLLISGGDEIISYNPETGEKLWSCEGASEATCGTIVWNEDSVFCSGGYPGQQTLAIRADGSSEILWSNNTKIYEPSMLVVGNELYAASDKGIVFCWDTETGNLNWKKRVGGSFSASPIHCDGLIYATKASGETIVFEASAIKFQEVASNQLGNDCYASPALCEGKLYFRVGVNEASQRQEYLYCLGEPSNLAID